jgi:hypothetical protein
MPRTLILIAVLVCCPGLFAADAVKVRTLNGKTEAGELVSVSNKEVVVRTKAGAIATPIAEVVELAMGGTPNPLPDTRYSDVELLDGSLLHCSRVAIKGDQVELRLVSEQDIKVPLKAVGWVLNDAHDPKARDEWRGLIARRGNLDLLGVRDTEGKTNMVEGTFGSGGSDGTTIDFESSAGAKRALNLSRIHGLAFVRKLDPELPPAVCRVHDAWHDTLAAANITYADGKLSVSTVTGASVHFPPAALVRLDFSQGKLTYLSDLEPIKVVESSNIEGMNHYRRDTNLDGGPLRLVHKSATRTEAQTYAKGLALHATTELVYDLGGQYKEFRAVLGVDPAVGGDSDVKLTIDGDGKELFSGEVKRQDSPRPIACDVTNIKQLRITVAPVGLLDLGNHVELAEAKVSK